MIDNKDKSELDFFRYIKPLKKGKETKLKDHVKKRFVDALKKFVKKYKKDKSCFPSALVALQDILKDRRKKQKELLNLQRINTIKYLQEQPTSKMASYNFTSIDNKIKDE